MHVPVPIEVRLVYALSDELCGTVIAGLTRLLTHPVKNQGSVHPVDNPTCPNVPFPDRVPL